MDHVGWCLVNPSRLAIPATLLLKQRHQEVSEALPYAALFYVPKETGSTGENKVPVEEDIVRPVVVTLVRLLVMGKMG